MPSLGRRLRDFTYWLQDLVIWYVTLPVTLLHWIWRWRYPVLWISSLSILYFLVLALAYYLNHYPENAITASLVLLSLVLTLWGYYNHKRGQRRDKIYL